jgi:hypothetical protein
MRQLINSEYRFTSTVEEQTTLLEVYIDYENKTYDIQQAHQEGIFCKTNNKETSVNKAYMLLAIDALDFIEGELYSKRK